MPITTGLVETEIRIVATKDGSLKTATTSATKDVKKIGDEAKKTEKKLTESAKKSGEAFEKVRKGPLNRFGRAIKNVFAVSLAFQFIRAVAFVERSISQLVRTGIEFSQFLEDSQLSFAGILSSTRNLGASMTDTIAATQAYPIILEKAKILQEQIVIASLSTLGNAQDLIEVMQRVLGFTSKQVTTDKERLQLGQSILNTGRLLGLNSDQIAQETRQILTLDNDRGQQILQALGLTVKQLRVYKEQGTLVQELNKRLEGFNKLADRVGRTFTGLVESVRTMVQLVASGTFTPIFEGLKQVLIGIRDELDAIRLEGGLGVILGATEADLRNLGREIARIIADTVNGLAKIVAGIIDFAAANPEALRHLANILGSIVQIFKDLAFVVTSVTRLYNKFTDHLSDVAKGTEDINKAFGRSANALQTIINKLDELFHIGDLLEGAFAGGLIGAIFGVPGITIGAAIGASLRAISLALTEVKDGTEELSNLYSQAPVFEELANDANSLITQLKAGEIPFDVLVESVDEFTLRIRNAQTESKKLDEALQLPTYKALEELLQSVLSELTLFEKKQDEVTKKLTVGERAALRFGTEVENLTFRLARLNSEASGDFGAVALAESAKITAQLAKDIESARGDATGIALANAKAILSQRLANIAAIKNEIKLLAEQTQQQTASIEATASIQEAVSNSRQTFLETEISLLENKLSHLKDESGTFIKQIALIKKIANLRNAGLEEDIRQLRDQLRVLDKIGDVREDAIKALEEKKEKLDLEAKSTEDLRLEILKLNEAQDQDIAKKIELQAQIDAIIAKQGILASNTAKEEKDLTTVTINVVGELNRTISDVFDAMIAGTLKVEDAFKSLSLGIVRAFVTGFAEALTAKFAFDTIIKKNVGGLTGVFQTLGSGVTSLFDTIFKTTGIDLNSFVHNLSLIPEALANLDFNAIFGAGGSLQSAFTNLGSVGAGLLGFGGGSIISSLFDIGESEQGKIGKKVGSLIFGIIGNAIGSAFGGPFGGTAGSFIGSFLGTVIGGLFGDLFASKPTKGTQIRKAVVSYLRELDVVFSDIIKRGEYQFFTTKVIADELGISFLEASKIALERSPADSDLKDQLVALGVAITQDMARDLGKSLEQTGITFANLIVDNLGHDSGMIDAFITDLVEKAEINFGGLVNELNLAFQRGLIGVELYTQAIRGATSLFFSDFPASIDVASIALATLTEDGIVDLERFEKKIEKVIINIVAVGESAASAFAQGIKEGLSGAEAAELFAEGLRNLLAASVIEEFTKNFIDNIFAGIDLSAGLLLSNAQIEAMAEEFEIAFDALKRILEAANLLPSALKDAADEADNLVDELKKVNDEIQEIDDALADIANRRISIKVDFQNNLAAVGAISPLQAASFETGSKRKELGVALIRVATAFLTNSPKLVERLERAEELVRELTDLRVAQFQAERSAILDNLRLEQEAIRNRFSALREAAQDAEEARSNSLQAQIDQEQELSDIRIEALEEQLSIAEKYRDLAISLDEQITNLLASTESPLSPQGRLAFLQREADRLRTSIAGATGEERVDLIARLADILEQQLGTGAFQRLDPEQHALFNGIIAELEALRNEAATLGAGTESLEAQILAEQQATTALLASLNSQLENSPDILDDLSRRETAALNAAESRATAAIRAASVRATAAITALAVTENFLANIRQQELERQREILVQQELTLFDSLVEMVGMQEATRRLADIEGAEILDRVDNHRNLQRISDDIHFIAGTRRGLVHEFDNDDGFSGDSPVSTGRNLNAFSDKSGNAVVFDFTGMQISSAGAGSTEDLTKTAKIFVKVIEDEVRHGKLGTLVKEAVS